MYTTSDSTGMPRVHDPILNFARGGKKLSEHLRFLYLIVYLVKFYNLLQNWLFPISQNYIYL